MDGEGAHEVQPLAKELLAVGGCLGDGGGG